MGYQETYHRAEVRSVSRLTPNMVQVRFGGAGLADWVTTGRGDERLVVVFPRPGDAEPPAPQQLPDCTRGYADDAGRPEMRSYTVRAWDEHAAEMLVDFVVHESGVAGPWAARAEPGQVVWLTQAAGWYDPPADTTWELLVADLTGLPALARIVAQLPAGRRAHAVVEVIEPGDRQPLPSAGTVEVSWLVGSGNGRGPSALPTAVEQLSWPEGPGYLWFAGEASASRAVRKHLRRGLGWSAERYDILGYWRVGKEEWMQRYEEVGPGLESVYAEAVAAGTSSTEALELYDDALERAGL